MAGMDSRLTLCCLRPLLNPDGDDEYYRILEIASRHCEEKVVKKQYRLLSLRLHPDKLAQRHQEVTEEDRARFVKLKEAYDCLADPRKRRIYDHLGQLGLQLHENPTSVSPQTVAKTIARVGNRCRCMILTFLLVLLVFFVLLFPLMLSLNVDGSTNIPWAVVWVPLWVIDGLLVLNHLAWVLEALQGSSPKKPQTTPDDATEGGAPVASEQAASAADVEFEDELHEDDEDDTPSAMEHDDTPMLLRLTCLAQLMLLVLFQILLVVRLDKGSIPWLAVFSPLFLWEASLAAQVIGPAFARVKAPVEDEDIELGGPETMERHARLVEYMQQLELRDAAHRMLRNIILRATFEVLLALALAERQGDDSSLQRISYWVVFLPVWVYAGLMYIRSLRFAQAALLISASADDDLKRKTPDNADGDPEEENEEEAAALANKREAAAEARFAASTSCCSCLFFVVFGVLTVLRCYDDAARFSAMVLFIPVFAMAACCFCCTSSVVCCFRDADGLNEQGAFDTASEPADDTPSKEEKSGGRKPASSSESDGSAPEAPNSTESPLLTTDPLDYGTKPDTEPPLPVNVEEQTTADVLDLD